ncbi:MAG TPA: transcriptional repressor [Candidatus Microsaccharimonas sp.]
MIERSTRYIKDVEEYLKKTGHSSNGEILESLRKRYADISATTVHRITARLVERGKLSLAPVAKGNVTRFDALVEPHDHFLCRNCDMLRDTNVADDIRPILEKSIGDGCVISGNLVITGVCKKCSKELKV